MIPPASTISNTIGKTWFQIDHPEEEDGEIIIDSRHNGDVHNETAGKADIEEGRRIAKALRAAYPENSIVADVCDEWVIVTFHPTKS